MSNSVSEIFGIVIFLLGIFIMVFSIYTGDTNRLLLAICAFLIAIYFEISSLKDKKEVSPI